VLLTGTILFFFAATLSAQNALDAAPDSSALQPGSAAPAPEIPAPASSAAPTTTPVDQHIDKRIFGVLPNYRTASGTAPFVPISAKRKLTIAAKDSFDYPVYFTAAAFAALYQLDDQNPSFGQGMQGYAKRFGSAYADQAVGNLMAEGLMPALLHEDPRYFRLGAGSEKTMRYRTLYALRGVMAAKNDHGNWTFNGAEWMGNASAAAISNLYYPSDTRNAKDNAQKLLIAVATDAFSNVLKEFWPDIKQKLFKNKQ
jgi:hypothetical protein